MNHLPFDVFSNIRHVHTFTLSRRGKGYEEVSIMDIYTVVSNGFPMFALAQRSGDQMWPDYDLRNVARITPSAAVVKEHVDLWRALFLLGDDQVVEVPGTSHAAWTKATTELDNEGTVAHRVVLRCVGTNDDIGYLYTINNDRMGIIRSEADACQFFHAGTASIAGTALLLSHQPDTLHDTIQYLTELHMDDFMLIVQKKAGNSWVDHEIVRGTINGVYRFNKEAFIKAIQ